MPPRPPPSPRPPLWPGGYPQPARLTTRGTQLVDSAGRHVVLQGVSMHLEYYINMFGNVRTGSSALDVAHLRRSLPAANAVRLIGLLWHDSIKEKDGLECSTNDKSNGYLDPTCLHYLDVLVQQLTEAGFWVILAARAKYAAGWLEESKTTPDVFRSVALRRRMYAMWRFISERYKWTDRMAGYEIMSEPRTRQTSQGGVRDFYRGGCDAVHKADPRVLCVVGPRPFYKVWELSDAVLQPKRGQVLYTFDFFVPSSFVMSNTAEERSERCGGPHHNATWCVGKSFPGRYQCKELFDTWWRGKPGCDKADSMVFIDGKWIAETLERVAVGFSKKHSVPIHLNQWGVKDEVFDANGRRRYAQAMLDALHAHSTSSTYWLWREKHKPHRDVNEDGVWGFELARNDGPHEALDGKMLATLQAGFARTALQHPGNLVPCGVEAATARPSFDVRETESTLASKKLVLGLRHQGLRYMPPTLPSSGVECNPNRLEARIDWTAKYQLTPNASFRAVQFSPPPPEDQPLPSDASMMLAAIAVVGVILFLIALATAFCRRQRVPYRTVKQ